MCPAVLSWAFCYCYNETISVSLFPCVCGFRRKIVDLCTEQAPTNSVQLIYSAMTLERASNEPNENLEDNRLDENVPETEATFDNNEIDNTAQRIEQLFNNLNERIDSLAIRPEIPQPEITPELLAEDEDLLDPEYEEIGNNIDVIDDYISKLDSQNNQLQARLREFLQILRENREVE